MSRNVQDVLSDIRENERLMNGRLMEREDVIHGMYLAAISRSHVQMFGPPGTAKSHASKLFFTQLVDAEKYDKLLTVETLEDELWGHMDPVVYANQGTYTYRTQGHATDAHFAFLDENYKASQRLLNSLLGWLNERYLRRSATTWQCPLISCHAASNEFEPALAPYVDRMLLAFFCDNLQKPANRMRLMQEQAARLNGNAPKDPTLRPISLDDWNVLHAAASAIPIDDTVFAILSDLQKNLSGVGVYISDRRILATMPILQAEALLAGDTDVGPEHCEVLRHCLWGDPADRENATAAVGAIDKGLIGEIRSLVENALARYYELRGAYDPTTDTWSSESARQTYTTECPEICGGIQNVAKEIQERFVGGVPSRVTRRAKQYLDELRQAFITARKDAQYALK